MLSSSFPLYFPKLVYLCETKVSNQTTKKSKSHKLYRLDWFYSEQVKKDKHQQWNEKYYPDVKIEWIDALPENLMNETEKLLFVIPHEYKQVINQSAAKAIEEWNADYPFDTVISEMCLGPAIEHVRVAFKLLADCIYDDENHYFDRIKKHQMIYCLLCRFWHHQCGRAMVEEHAGITDLKYQYGMIETKLFKHTATPKVIKQLEDHQAKIDSEFYKMGKSKTQESSKSTNDAIMFPGEHNEQANRRGDL